MGAEVAAPCRHAGAAPQAVIDRVSGLFQALGEEEMLLCRHGLTAAEFNDALPAAIEALRGRMSASNTDRRQFLAALFEAMLAKGLIEKLTMPAYGDDTVYRLTIGGYGDIAIVQKGCPDGAHSSVRWSVPEWAKETYLWWLCSSMSSQPGVHISKGVHRLRQRFFSDAPGTVDGVIFHNQLCGSSQRPCPKTATASIFGARTPPPCIYVMPERQSETDEWNWTGSRLRVFPAVLLNLFDVSPADAAAYTGHIGFQQGSSGIRATITSRFGPGRSTTHRS